MNSAATCAPLPAQPSSGAAPPLSASDRKSLAAFDDEQEWAAFGQALEGPEAGCWQSQVLIEGMHCAACALNIEQALLAQPGVRSVQVSSAARRARVVWDAALTRPSQWLAAALGYRLLPDLAFDDGQARRLESRRMLWRWLVAGFCMMQIMMYAYPAYITAPGTIPADIEQLMAWASWMLSLPVMLFCAQPFFAQAVRDLRARRISMDLPVALGLLIAFGASSAATFDPHGLWGGPVYFDSLSMFVFFLLTGRWLELRLRERTAGSLHALMQRLPHSVEREQADGSYAVTAARRLRVGDVIRVLPGQAFAADGQVLEGQTHVDESLLSGESRPLPRQVSSAVLAGSYNLSATVRMRVVQLGQGTRYQQIVALMQQAALDKPRLAVLADRVARPFLWAVLLAAALAALLWWPTDPARGLMAAVAVLVVTCPCALSLATPSAVLTSAGALARQGMLVRRLQAFQTLEQVDTVVFDKTGTLTQARLGLRETVMARSDIDALQVLQLAASLARHSLHPVSRALVAAAEQEALTLLPVGQVQEQQGQGVQGELAAAPGGLGRTLRLGRAQFCGLEPSDSEQVQVYLADERGLIARFDFDEVLREGAQALLDALRQSGLRVQLLSGDRAAPVRALARRLGLAQARSQCSAQDKRDWVRAEQVAGHRVLMVGDGLNDGPVLAQADVSLAVGASVPLAQAQADVVLPSGQLQAVWVLLDQSRRTQAVVRQNLAWAAVYNALGVPLAAMGWLPAWLAGLGMALSSLAVVLNAARLARHRPFDPLQTG
jgi:Cu2+-exporting ATPase